MNLNYLDFEQPIAELEAKIQELRMVDKDGDINISDEIARLEIKSKQLTRDVFSRLTPWQMTQLARHPLRPHAIDYINQIFTEFDEMKGDRMLSSGPSIIGGTARFEGQPVMIIGHEKGRKTQEKIERNFGMPQPEDYRKALRLMKMAERFKLPLLLLLIRPGLILGLVQKNAIKVRLLHEIYLSCPNLKHLLFVPLLARVVREVPWLLV